MFCRSDAMFGKSGSGVEGPSTVVIDGSSIARRTVIGLRTGRVSEPVMYVNDDKLIVISAGAGIVRFGKLSPVTDPLFLREGSQSSSRE